MTDPSDPSELAPEVVPALGRRTIVRSSAVVAAGTALSRVTGVFRVGALVYALGQTRLSDVYTVANTMPNLIYELLLGGVLSATLVPVFAERVDEEDGGTAAVVSVAGIALVVVTVVGVVAAPAVIDVFAAQLQEPVAGEVAAYSEVGTTLLRFFMPQVLFYGLITIVTALLHARRSFAAPAYAPVLNNLVVTAMFLSLPAIVGRDTSATDALVDAVGDSTLVLLLGLGTTVGVVVMALAMVPSLVRLHVPLRFDPDWRHPAVRRVVRLSGWTIGYVVANQVALLVVYALANRGDGGDLTAYNVAFTFFQLPHGLFAVSIMTTFLPELAEAARRRDDGVFRERFAMGLRMMALVVLPASAGYMALAQPLVGILPLGGASVELTAGILVAFAAGLAGFSTYLYALRGFYARQDTRTPFVLNLGENVAHVALAVPFLTLWGIEGLAAAYSVAYLLSAVAALVVLSRRVGGLVGGGLVGSAGRMAVASVACGLAAWGASTLVGTSDWLQLVVGVSAGALTYLVALLVLRVEEVEVGRRMLTARLGRG
jgi:putative peptidoglycan lipid II flippase